MDVDPWEEEPSLKEWTMACVDAHNKPVISHHSSDKDAYSMEARPLTPLHHIGGRDQNNSHKNLRAMILSW